MCSTANPEGESECFVCGFIRDEAAELEDRLAREAAEREEARLAAIEAERAAEEERLRRAEEARRAELARRLREEAARRSGAEGRRRADAARAAEADRLRRAEEERRRAEEERRRRAAAEATDRAIAKERRGINAVTIIFRVLFFLSVGVFVTVLLFAQINLWSKGKMEIIVYNFKALLEHFGVRISNLSEVFESNIILKFILDSHTKEVLDTALASLNGHLTELYTVLLPLLQDKLLAAWVAVSTAAVGIFTAVGRKFGDAASRVTEVFNTVSDSLSLMWQRLGELLRGSRESFAEADSTVREAINGAAENINKLKN